MIKKDKNAVSLAGEFAVLSQLALKDYDANMTLGHTKGVDILVSNPQSGQMYRLEVKTTLAARGEQSAESKIFGTVLNHWMMSEKHETIIDPSLFYCFVIIWQEATGARTRFFVIPSSVVARYVMEEHRLWLTEKKKEGKTVKDTSIRAFRIGFKGQEYSIDTPTVEQYENNWEFRS